MSETWSKITIKGNKYISRNILQENGEYFPRNHSSELTKQGSSLLFLTEHTQLPAVVQAGPLNVAVLGDSDYIILTRK
jgi:hypothetical protein